MNTIEVIALIKALFILHDVKADEQPIDGTSFMISCAALNQPTLWCEVTIILHKGQPQSVVFDFGNLTHTLGQVTIQVTNHMTMLSEFQTVHQQLSSFAS